jgi:hypothetical protein
MTTNTIPQFEQRLLKQGGTTDKNWYFFWQALWKGLPQAAETAVVLSPTPFTYTSSQRGFVIVQGGTVSLIQFSRDGVTNYSTGQTSGCFPLAAGDSLIINYTVAPSVTFVPQ